MSSSISEFKAPLKNLSEKPMQMAEQLIESMTTAEPEQYTDEYRDALET